jgi:hypothetical protein
MVHFIEPPTAEKDSWAIVGAADPAQTVSEPVLVPPATGKTVAVLAEAPAGSPLATLTCTVAPLSQLLLALTVMV